MNKSLPPYRKLGSDHYSKLVTQFSDDMTVRYRVILESLPSIERKVLVALLDMGGACGQVWEIAAKARLEKNTVSALLGRLADREIVTVRELKGHKNLYHISDPVFTVYRAARHQNETWKRMIELNDDDKDWERLMREIE